MELGLLPFDQYSTRFEHLRLERTDAILQITQHSSGQTLQWGGPPQIELAQAFRFVGADPDNRVVILTGTGDQWNGPPVSDDEEQYRRDPDRWAIALSIGTQLQLAALDIAVPVIAAVNGPVYRHVEIPFLADIVLASEDATFDDRGHFPVNLTAGDGVFTVTSMLMGHNRARYFHLTGQVLDAATAREWGIVAEVLPKHEVLSRAWELARTLAAKPTQTLRNQRLIFTYALKRRLQEEVGLGLALEGLAGFSTEMPPPPRPGISSSVY